MLSTDVVEVLILSMGPWPHALSARTCVTVVLHGVPRLRRGHFPSSKRLTTTGRELPSRYAKDCSQTNRLIMSEAE